MSELFLKVVNMSISASWLVLAVVLLRLVLKKSPKWVGVVLWGIVAVRLLCPFSVESALSLIPSAETVSPQIMLDQTPEIHTGVPVINSTLNPVIGEVFAPNPATSANPLQILISVSAAVWVVGMGALMLFSVVSYLRLRSKISTAVILRGNIFQSENVVSPFVFGIINPKIYLPLHMDGVALENVVAHEQAHIQRKDHWWKPVGFLLLTVHWFNPFMWLAYVLLCRDIELACDECVIRALDNEKRADYTQTLLNCSISRRTVIACPLAFGEVGIKNRVKSVLHYKKPAFWGVVLSILVCGAVAVCFLTDPKDDRQKSLPLIDSHSYVVEEVTYRNPAVSATMWPGENTPCFAITEGMQLLYKEANTDGARWVNRGRLTEVALSKENFDELFFHDMGWVSGESAATIRRNTGNAWMLVYDENVLVYVLQQNDGTVYLARGYYDHSEKNDPGSDDTNIQQMFRLTYDISKDTGIIAISGENTVPVVVFPVGTNVKDVKDSLFWLNIAEGSDRVYTPFQVFCDGNEQFGWYNVYDAETFGALDFFRPSGLAPQTYLFQNAEYGRDYIVTLQINESDLLCFGARLRENVEKKYYLTVGADGVAEIGIKTPNSSGGCVNADGSLFKKGDTVWLESLEGLQDLQGVTISAMDEEGTVLWALSIPEDGDGKDLLALLERDGAIVATDGWIISVES